MSSLIVDPILLMRRTCGAILAIALAAASAPVTAAGCGNDTIYALNGVFVDRRDAGANSDTLMESVGPALTADELRCTRFKFIYNDSSPLSDVLETLLQSRGLSSSDFWSALSGLTSFPPYVSDFFGRLSVDSAFNANALDLNTLDRIASESRSTIKAGGRVIIVAHSQGNLYTNSVVQGALLTDIEMLSWATVNVAVPDERVMGALTPYTTLLLDGVIGSIDAAARSLLQLNPPLPANTDDGYANPFARALNHSFVAAYMAGEPSRTQIVNNTVTTLRALKVPGPVVLSPPFTIGPGDVIDVAFNFPSGFSGTPNTVAIAIYQPSGSSAQSVNWTATLFDDTQMLGSYASGSASGIVGPAFYTPSSFWAQTSLGASGVVDFTSIVNRTIAGRLVIEISSGTFVYDPRVIAYPGTAQEARGSVLVLADQCQLPCSILGYGAVTSVKLNGTRVY